MATMLVVVQTGNPDEVLKRMLVDQIGGSSLPEGVKQVHRTAWTIEVPKCSAFFATLIRNAKQDGRTCLVAEIAPGTVPQCPYGDP